MAEENTTGQEELGAVEKILTSVQAKAKEIDTRRTEFEAKVVELQAIMAAMQELQGGLVEEIDELEEALETHYDELQDEAEAEALDDWVDKVDLLMAETPDGKLRATMERLLDLVRTRNVNIAEGCSLARIG